MASKRLTRLPENPPDVLTDEAAQWIPDWFSEPVAENRDPLYAIVIHDDDVHTCHDYTETLQEVFGYSQPQAYQLTQELAQNGRSVVWQGGLEEAERKAQAIRDYQPRWRRGESVTAPRWQAESVPPLTVTVVLSKPANDSRKTTAANPSRDFPQPWA